MSTSLGLKDKPAVHDAGRNYRPDIDGLRAVAVLSVVLYHINKNLVPGGYIGVDIFFVISGYLITRNIWREIREGRFSFLKFYLRRVHRIYPAFAVVTITTLLTGAMLLLPADMIRLARSAFWSALSLPNVYFWKYLDTAYFAAASEEEPLLHMWSLGVEEQFYFLWPCMLLALFVLGRRRAISPIFAASLIAVFSFAYAEAFLAIAPKFTYYMLPSRAGELMVGALLALAPSFRAASPTGNYSPLLNEVFSAVGVALVVWALIFLDDNSRFPGLNALWPCLGTALIIFAGDGRPSWVSRHVLSLQPMVFVGLISYSLYLWHWPILAFIRYFAGQISGISGAASFILMFVLAWLSYRFVESPLRHWRPRALVSFGVLWAAPLFVVFVISYFLLQTHGLKQFVGDGTSKSGLANAVAPAYSFPYVCQVSETDANVLRDPRCRIGASVQNGLNVLLWGDSKAAQYVGFFDEVGRNKGFTLRNAEHSSCAPIFADGRGNGRFKESCNDFWKVMRSGIAANAYDVVIIGGSWAAYGGHPKFQSEIRATISSIASTGAKVVILSDVPTYKGYNRECWERNVRLRGFAVSCEAGEGAVKPDLNPEEVFLTQLAEENPDQLSFINFKMLLCPNGRCRTTIAGAPLYYDEGHISLEGGRGLAKELIENGSKQNWLAAFTKKQD